MNLPARRIAAASVLLLSMAGACATMRDQRLREQLDAHQFPKPLAEVWPEALRLLADHDYQLVGKDREVAGQRADDGNPLNRGFETRQYSDGRRAAETRPNSAEIRYRVEGVPVGEGACRIYFFALHRSMPEYDKWSHRDAVMELGLVQRVEPEVADRIEQAVK
jgi:hypothetical protein